MKIHYNTSSKTTFIHPACCSPRPGIPATRDMSRVTCKRCLRRVLPAGNGPVVCYDENLNVVEWRK